MDTTLLTKQQVAARLQIKPHTVVYLYKTHQLKGFILARKLRFRPEAVEALVRNCEKKVDSEARDV